jgi:hypothetical protein
MALSDKLKTIIVASSDGMADVFLNNSSETAQQRLERENLPKENAIYYHVSHAIGAITMGAPVSIGIISLISGNYITASAVLGTYAIAVVSGFMGKDKN